MNQKSEELRRAVGESYRDLIVSADSIIEMNEVSSLHTHMLMLYSVPQYVSIAVDFACCEYCVLGFPFCVGLLVMCRSMADC